MNGFDFKILQSEIVTASRQALHEVAEAVKEDEIVAFALYSDEGAMTVCPSINTKSHLLKFKTENPKYSLDYKFSPAEWKFESVGAAGLFNAICEKASSEVLKEETDFSTFQEQLYETCCKALRQLRNDPGNLFDTKKLMLLFSVSDGDIDDRQIEVVKELNDSATADEFIAWVKGQ